MWFWPFFPLISDNTALTLSTETVLGSVTCSLFTFPFLQMKQCVGQAADESNAFCLNVRNSVDAHGTALKLCYLVQIKLTSTCTTHRELPPSVLVIRHQQLSAMTLETGQT